MTPEDRRLSEIAARLAVATPGPWLIAYSNRLGPAQVSSAHKIDGRYMLVGVLGLTSDADFIAHAHDDIQWLLEQLGATGRGRI